MRTIILIALISIVFLNSFFVILAQQKEYVVEPNTIGLGLQKNVDVDMAISGETKCIPYDIGNPSSTNSTGWIKVSGNLSQFHAYNNPETLFVPSGTWRYNNTCCLLRMDTCFQIPYVFNETPIDGKVTVAFTVTAQPTTVTGSAVTSTSAYNLILNIKPIFEVMMKPSEKKCFNYYFLDNVESYGVIGDANKIYLPEESTYSNNQINYCFKIPSIIFFDQNYTATLKINDKNEGNLNIIVKGNILLVIGIVAICLIIIISIIWVVFRKKSQPSQPSTSSELPSFSPQPLDSQSQAHIQQIHQL